MLQRTLSAKLMKEDPRSVSGLGSGGWRLEPGARCQLLAGYRWGVGNYWAGQESWSTTDCACESVCEGADVTVTATVPHGARMVPQLWECGPHWSGSIGNDTTDARGWNWALDAAMDDGGEAGRGGCRGQWQQQRSRQDGRAAGGLMWAGCWMLDAGC